MTTKTHQEPGTEYVILACDTSDHLIRFLGGQKAPEQIVDACRFPLAQQNTQTDETCWMQNDKRLLAEEKIEVLHQIHILFDTYLQNYKDEENWKVHLQNFFPTLSLTEITVKFHRENRMLIQKYRNLLTTLEKQKPDTDKPYGDDLL